MYSKLHNVYCIAAYLTKLSDKSKFIGYSKKEKKLKEESRIMN